MKIVFVIPVFNEKPTLAPLIEGICTHAKGHEMRVIMVDDGSDDGSFEEACALQQQYPQLDVIRFKQNYGKTLALHAAFDQLADDVEVVITMDADLQDDPREIPRMLAKLEEGFDLVCGWKRRRHDPLHKTFPSKIYNGIIARLFNLKVHDVNTGFKAMRLEVAKKVPLYGDMHRMIAVHAHLLGYRITEIPVEHHARRFGSSKYGMDRFVKGARDVLKVWRDRKDLATGRAKHDAIDTTLLIKK